MMEHTAQAARPTDTVNKSVLGIVAFNDFLERLQLGIGALCILLFVLSVFIDVLFRIAFKPIVVLEEASRFFFLWSVFVGASITIRRKTFLKIDMLTARLKGVSHATVTVISYIIGLTFTLIMLYYGTQFAFGGMNKFSFPSGVPLFYFRLCIPFSALFMLSFNIEGIVKAIAGYNPEPLPLE